MYINLYYFVAVLSLFGSALSLSRASAFNNRTYHLDISIALLVCFAYAIAMARQDGIDYVNYIAHYYGGFPEVPDLGYNAIVFIFRALDLPFEILAISSGLFSLFALKRASLFFKVNFTYVVTIYFLHLAVVRDFAQFRSGLSIAIVVYALTLPGFKKKWLLYLLAGSVHYSTFAFIFAYEFCQVISKFSGYKKQLAAITVGSLGILFLGKYTELIGSIDARVELYQSWEEEGYGLPVGQFSIMAFQLILLAIFFLARRSAYYEPQFRTLVYLQFLGIIAFLAFKDTAIISYRVSSAILSLYPVALTYALTSLRSRVHVRSRIRFPAGLVFFIVGVILLNRQGSYEILDMIRFGENYFWGY